MLDPDEIDGRCLVDHDALMASIDKLALWGGFASRSALAKAAGLDKTTLSQSKMAKSTSRLTKPRWIALNTLLSLCRAAELSIVDWALLYQEIAAERAARRPVAYTEQDITERMGAAA